MTYLRAYTILLTIIIVQSVSSELPSDNKSYIKFDNDSLYNCHSVNPTAILVKGSLAPDVIPMPGTAYVTGDIVFTKPLPLDLQLRLNLTKQDPYLFVPCFSGEAGSIGSCEYDVCEMVLNPGFCNAIIPPEMGCTCPLASGTFALPTIALNVPNMGGLFEQLMKGNYIGQAIMYSKANPDWTIGCLEFRFELQAQD